MGILLSRLQNRGPIEEPVNSPLEDSNLVDVSATSVLLEHWVKEMPELDNLLLESVRGIYFGLKDRNPSLVAEASFDLGESAISWFNKHVSGTTKNARESIKRIRNVATPYQKISTKNLNVPTDITVRANIFKYSIVSDPVNIGYADEFIIQLRASIDEVEKASNFVELQSNCANIKSKLTGDGALDHIRGKLTNNSPHGTADYKENLYNFFRSGGIATVEEFNSNRARGILLQFKNLDKILATLEKDISIINKLAKNMSSHIKSNVKMVNSRIKDRLAHNIEILDGKSKHNLPRLKNRAMLDILTNFTQSLKKLIMVYELYITAKIDATYEMVRSYGRIVHALYGGEK